MRRCYGLATRYSSGCPPVVHPNVKRLLFISSVLFEQGLHRAFLDEEIEVRHIKPTAWVAGNRVFQIRTGIYPRETLLNYDTDWHVLGMSETEDSVFFSVSKQKLRGTRVLSTRLSPLFQ